MTPKLSLNGGVLEIRGDNGAHYLAKVVDVYDPNDPCVVSTPSGQTSNEPLITLRFQNDWRQREAFPLSRIRLSPNEDNNQRLTEGKEAEVWRAKIEGHECGFWKCVIKMVKDDFYGVSYGCDLQNNCKIDGKEFNEIVTKDRIRAMNPNPYLTRNPFFKFLVEVPKDLLAMFPNEVRRSEIHKQLKNTLSLVAVSYDKQNHRLVCIGFALTDKETAYRKAIKNAEFLAEVHFRAVKVEIEMRTQIDVLRNQLKNLDEVIKIKENEFEILVRVEEQFMRYAIGQNGSNIKKVLQMPGVLSVDRVSGVEENVFKVVATNRASLRAAKETLQITEKVMNIPKDLVPHIIGKKGVMVQEMTDKSGLISIKVKGEDPNEVTKPYVPFHLIGTKETIENGSLLLAFQMSCVKENIEFDRNFSPKRVNKRLSN